MAVSNTEKDKALDAALLQIQKQFGKGAIMKLGDDNALTDIQAISTGSITLDVATGIGGVPRGRIIEIYGPESSGKTTLTLHIIAEAQKTGGKAAFIDAEHALDPVYASNIGVDIDNLYISQPDNGEQALEITETMVQRSILLTRVRSKARVQEITDNKKDSQYEYIKVKNVRTSYHVRLRSIGSQCAEIIL